MTSRLRVLQINSAFNDEAPAQGAAALARHLDPREFDVTAVSLRPQDDSATTAELRRSGIHHVSLGMKHFLDVRVLHQLIHLMRAYRPNIVHTHAFRADFWAGLAARLCRVPVFVSSIRGQEWDLFQADHPSYVAAVAMAASKCSTSLADILIAVSEGVRHHLVLDQKIPASKVRVIPNGVDLAKLACPRPHPFILRRQLNIPPDADLVGTFAVFKPRKGLAYLLQAARSVVLVHPHVHFVLAGDGPERAALEREVVRLGLGRQVHLLGFRHDAVALMDALDLYVLPSLYEGMPRSVLEAMGLGKAVIVTDIGGSREAVVHNVTGLIVPPQDSDRLAEAICRMIESPTLRKSMGEKGRQVVETRLNAKVNAVRHEELYRELHCTKVSS